jgi:hypothetical protein
MAMMASKGCLGLVAVAEPDRSVVDDESKSVALIPSPEELAWSWDAE